MSGIGAGFKALNAFQRIGIAVGGFMLLLAGLALILRSCEKREERHENQLINQGATQERGRQNEETLNAVQNAARPATDAERQRVCSRYDRNRAANCP